jgi:hypothetical protein
MAVAWAVAVLEIRVGDACTRYAAVCGRSPVVAQLTVSVPLRPLGQPACAGMRDMQPFDVENSHDQHTAVRHGNPPRNPF